MEETGITKLFDVFRSQNRILRPVENIDVFQIVEQIASLFAAGSFYYFIFNLVTLEFDYVSEGTKPLLGIKSKDFTILKFLKILHPEDQNQMRFKESTSLNLKLNVIAKQYIKNYKTVYLMRVKDKKGNYKIILHQVKALTISEDGKIQQTIGVHTDVTYLKIPFDHKISFIPIDSKLQSYHFEYINNKYVLTSGISGQFTKREKEIIKLLGQGKKVSDIADILYISKHTVNTHKKNIFKKSNCNNSAELVVKCLREGFM
jgi:DNA-binding CsgD family transcriptional regulator